MLSGDELGTMCSLYVAVVTGNRLASDVLEKAERMIHKQAIARMKNISGDELESVRNLIAQGRKQRSVTRGQ